MLSTVILWLKVELTYNVRYGNMYVHITFIYDKYICYLWNKIFVSSDQKNISLI